MRANSAHIAFAGYRLRSGALGTSEAREEGLAMLPMVGWWLPLEGRGVQRQGTGNRE